MYLTVKQQVKHLTKKEFQILQDLSHTAKNLANEAIYNVRQYYFAEGRYLTYASNYKLLKNSPNYKKINSNMAQQILKEVDGSFKSFFGLLKKSRQGEYDTRSCRLPGYLPKDGYTTLVIGFVRLNGDRLIIPYSNSYRRDHTPISIKIPPILRDKKIKEIRIIPRGNAAFFEIQYTYEVEVPERKLDDCKALALDLGVDNLAAGVTNEGRTFLIDGRRLKSINQQYNKENARLQSIKDKQNYGKKQTARQISNTRCRNNRVNDYLCKTAKEVIGYCIRNNIGRLIVGYNKDFQKSMHMGKRNNQIFVNIPYGRLMQKLEYLCKMNGIKFTLQEESYTSKASFFDRDPIPVYGEECVEKSAFSGVRIKRGLYRTANGTVLNADINGALNILKKSNVVSLEALYARGDVDTPVRIRIA